MPACARVVLSFVLLITGHAAFSQNLVITNVNPPIVLPLEAGSGLAFNDGDGPRQYVAANDLVQATIQCQLDGGGQCVFIAGTNSGGLGLVFSNTFQSVLRLPGTALQFTRSGGEQVFVADAMFVDIRCATTASGTCIGLPQPPPPTVSLAFSDPSAPPAPNGGLQPGTSFTITPSVTNATYCTPRQRGATLAGWSGTLSPPFAPVRVTIGDGSATATTLSLQCFNETSSTTSGETVFFTSVPGNCPPNANLSLDFDHTQYRDAFGDFFPAVGTARLDFARERYAALEFFVTAGTSGRGAFTVPPASADAAVAMTISACSGNFSFASIPAACQRIGNGTPLAWSSTGDDVSECRLPSGRYFLNVAFVNASGAYTCPSFDECRASVVAQSGLVVTQPIPPLEPGTAGAPVVPSAVQLGASSAFGGKVMVVGLPEADQGAGRVFVYRRPDFGVLWSYEATLTAQDKAIGDKFGASVAVSGDGGTIIVGAPLDDHGGGTDRGSARVYRIVGETWATSVETMLVASNPADGDRYGSAVDVSPDAYTFLIGAPFRNSGSGEAYYLRSGALLANAKDGVVETPSLPAPKGAKAAAAIGDKYGSAVATESGPNGGRWIIGAPGHDGGRGFVRVVRDAGGTFVQNENVLSPAASPGDGFGSSVAIDGNKFAVGAPGDDVDPQGVEDGNAADDRVDQGSLAVIEYTPADVRLPIDVLASETAAAGDALGTTVAINRGLALAAGPDTDAENGDGQTLPQSGRVAMFQLCGSLDCGQAAAKGTARWRFARTLIADSTLAGDRFGTSLAFDGDTILVGAPRRGGQVGSAHVFDVVTSARIFGSGFEDAE